MSQGSHRSTSPEERCDSSLRQNYQARSVVLLVSRHCPGSVLIGREAEKARQTLYAKFQKGCVICNARSLTFNARFQSLKALTTIFPYVSKSRTGCQLKLKVKPKMNSITSCALPSLFCLIYNYSSFSSVYSADKTYSWGPKRHTLACSCSATKNKR